MEMVDLRPCPFCGNNVRLEDREFDDFAGSYFTNTMFVIECEKCGISMKRYPKRGYGTTDEQKQDLINLWNRRTEDLTLKEQKERIGVLERTIERIPKPVKLLDVFGNGYARIVRCKDCRFKECEGRNGFIVCDITGESHQLEWFCADGERK